MFNEGQNLPKFMMGAIVGDIAGSIYERRNIKHLIKESEMIKEASCFTDDTVMTCAVATGFVNGLSKCAALVLTNDNADESIEAEIVKAMKDFGKRYINAGYGYNFLSWILLDESMPYNSFGNGSAMRVSYAGWIAKTLEEAERFGRLSAEVTHNHPEGIKGAKVIAGMIFLLRQTKDKDLARKYAASYYDIGFSLDKIRNEYHFDVSCQGSVPQAIVAFLEGENFVDVISKAISIGGDSDTIAAIAGSLAETIYEIPYAIKRAAFEKLDQPLIDAIELSVAFAESI